MCAGEGGSDTQLKFGLYFCLWEDAPRFHVSAGVEAEDCRSVVPALSDWKTTAVLSESGIEVVAAVE